MNDAYELGGLIERHRYLKNEHHFLPGEAEALLCFNDPLAVAQNCWEENGYADSYPIIDSRYRCNKPLIVTTNLKLDELKHPPDLAHARIYDRILEHCAPILFAGKNFREDNAATMKVAARGIVTR